MYCAFSVKYCIYNKRFPKKIHYKIYMLSNYLRGFLFIMNKIRNSYFKHGTDDIFYLKFHIRRGN